MIQMTVQPSHILPPAKGFRAGSIATLCGPHVHCCAATFTRKLLTPSETTSGVHARSRRSIVQSTTDTDQNVLRHH